MRGSWWKICTVLLVTPLAALAQQVLPGLDAKKAGDEVTIGGKKVTVKEMSVLPLVRNSYSAVFSFEAATAEATRLETLRKQEKLDEVVAPAKTEFDRQVALLAWANRRLKLFGPPTVRLNEPLEILKASDEGKAFNCDYYARLLQGALRSMGYVTRNIGLKGAKSDGNGSEHGVIETWSNQYRKWVVLDPTLSIYFEKAGVPLNAYEVRQEWFYNDGKDLGIMLADGVEPRKKVGKADLPVTRGPSHPGFGTLAIRPESIGKFLYICYTPLLADGRYDYGKMFITRDSLCEGVSYHTRRCPDDPAVEPYWPMQQAGLTLSSEGAGVKVTLATFTPDFSEFQVRLDGGVWKASPDSFTWKLHAGTNRLEARSVNKLGVEGAVSAVELAVAR